MKGERGLVRAEDLSGSFQPLVAGRKPHNPPACIRTQNSKHEQVVLVDGVHRLGTVLVSKQHDEERDDADAHHVVGRRHAPHNIDNKLQKTR